MTTSDRTPGEPRDFEAEVVTTELIRAGERVGEAAGAPARSTKLRRPSTTDVVLDRHELGELLELLQEPRWPAEVEPFTNLRAEIAAALGHGL